MTTPINGITRTLAGAGLTPGLDPTGEGPERAFAETFKRALGEINDLQTTAQDSIGAFLRGEDVELHEVMASAEEAGIAVEMLVEVRNKLVEAYRTIVNMQS